MVISHCMQNRAPIYGKFTQFLHLLPHICSILHKGVRAWLIVTLNYVNRTRNRPTLCTTCIIYTFLSQAPLLPCKTEPKLTRFSLVPQSQSVIALRSNSALNFSIVDWYKPTSRPAAKVTDSPAFPRHHRASLSLPSERTRPSTSV